MRTEETAVRLRDVAFRQSRLEWNWLKVMRRSLETVPFQAGPDKPRDNSSFLHYTFVYQSFWGHCSARQFSCATTSYPLPNTNRLRSKSLPILRRIFLVVSINSQAVVTRILLVRARKLQAPLLGKKKMYYNELIGEYRINIFPSVIKATASPPPPHASNYKWGKIGSTSIIFHMQYVLSSDATKSISSILLIPKHI
jgi:hypothetical protein